MQKPSLPAKNAKMHLTQTEVANSNNNIILPHMQLQFRHSIIERYQQQQIGNQDQDWVKHVTAMLKGRKEAQQTQLGLLWMLEMEHSIHN